LLRKWGKTQQQQCRISKFSWGGPRELHLPGRREEGKLEVVRAGERRGGEERKGRRKEGRKGHESLAPHPRGKILSTPLSKANRDLVKGRINSSSGDPLFKLLLIGIRHCTRPYIVVVP